MAKKLSALAGIFDDEPEAEMVPEAPRSAPETAPSPPRKRSASAATGARAGKSSHPGKKPVLIHIPEDMHRTLRQLSVEEGGEPLTVVTERMLRRYLVERGHTKFAP